MELTILPLHLYSYLWPIRGLSIPVPDPAPVEGRAPLLGTSGGAGCGRGAARRGPLPPGTSRGAGRRRGAAMLATAGDEPRCWTQHGEVGRVGAPRVEGGHGEGGALHGGGGHSEGGQCNTPGVCTVIN